VTTNRQADALYLHVADTLNAVAARHLSIEHLYSQPSEGEYRVTAFQLRAALEAALFTPTPRIPE